MPFILAHLSDAHIGPLPRPRLRELMGKRLTGYANWLNGRAQAHDMAVLGRLVADLRAQAPDHIAMTGDILNLGLADEYPLARRWLATLGDPAHVSFVPGNHDAYARGTLGVFARAFVPWTQGDEVVPAIHRETAQSRFPYVRRRGRVALIGLSSAIPTAPFLASGALGAAQLGDLANRLVALGREGLARVILIHHPPHRAGAPPARGLRDAPALEALVARDGAELILHGHNHRMALTHIVSRDRLVPVAGVASASLRPGSHGHGAGYRLFRLEHTDDGWRVSMRTRHVLADGALAELGAPERWRDIGAKA